MAKNDIDNITPDLDAQLNEAFNSMIGEVLADLVDESPVWTGFLASSWRAQKSQVRQKDKVEDFQPWAEYARIGKNLKKGEKPPSEIEPRFSPPTFDYKKGCFIGNQAEYSNYIIEDPGLVRYLKHDIQKTINRNFKEKKRRGAVKIGSVQKKVLFGKGSKKGRKYTGTSEF